MAVVVIARVRIDLEATPPISLSFTSGGAGTQRKAAGSTSFDSLTEVAENLDGELNLLFPENDSTP